MSKKSKDGELVTQDQVNMNDLIPLGVQFLENNLKQSQAENEIQRAQLQLGEERQKIQKSAFSHKFWLLVVVTLSILGISVGLIFIKDDTVTGMSMLSHIGAVIVGIIGGNGWERSRNK